MSRIAHKTKPIYLEDEYVRPRITDAFLMGAAGGILLSAALALLMWVSG